jgi:hypothetical protein
MRAFNLRRVELIGHQVGDGVLVGSNHSADILQFVEGSMGAIQLLVSESGFLFFRRGVKRRG